MPEPQANPIDRATAGLESSIASQGVTFANQQSALAPMRSALSNTLAEPIPQAPQPQKVAPAPKANEYQASAMAFAGAMTVLGAVASKYTRASGMTSLAAFNGAIKGWQEGNQEAYERSAKEWEQNTKATVENNKQELQSYKTVLENRRMNIDQQMSQIQLVAAQYHDKMMFDAAQAKNYTMVAQIYQKKEEYGQRVKQSAEALEERRTADRQRLESTANYWLSPDGVAKRQTLSPEQNTAIDKLISTSGAKSGGVMTPERVALQKFLEEKPDATAEDIQRFRNQGKQPRSAAGMSLAKFLEENPNATSEEIQKFQARQAGLSAEERTGGTTAAGLDIIMRNAHAAIPQAAAASEKVPRGQWVPINRLVQTLDSNISDPNLKSFRLANLQVAELWARAMNPRGVMRESDRELALQMLSTADSKETYKLVLQQLEQFLVREQKAVREFREHKPMGGDEAEHPAAGGDAGWSVKRID